MSGEAITYGTTLALGGTSPPTTIAGLQKLTSGGVDVTAIKIAALDDTTPVVKFRPGRQTPKPMTATMLYKKTNFTTAGTLRRTTQYVDPDGLYAVVTYADGSTWSGRCTISSVSDPDIGEDDALMFTIDIQPSGDWTFAEGA